MNFGEGVLVGGERREVFEGLKRAVIDGDEGAAKRWAEEAVKKGIDAYEAIANGCLEGMNVVGEKAMSALMTTTMPGMGKVIQMLKDEGLRDQVKVIIGGAPTTEEFARKIEADAWNKDAMVAVELAKKFVQST